MKKGKHQLIPFEHSKRVIYLEERGRRKKNISPLSVIFVVLGVLCILYCIAVWFVGFGTRFFLIWAVLGIASIVLSVILSSRKILNALPKWLKGSCVILFSAGVLLFCVVEGMVLSQFNAKAQPGADYCIVLGAQWKRNGPSEVLRRRLDKAMEYLSANPDTRVIVSGGQGSNEVISEAAGMSQYLINAGIAEERILLEDKSTNTQQNFAYSAELLDKKNSRVVVVTNNFHVFRALRIAEKQGYQAEGLAASSVNFLLPNNLLREFCGVLKDFCVGNI